MRKELISFKVTRSSAARWLRKSSRSLMTIVVSTLIFTRSKLKSLRRPNMMSMWNSRNLLLNISFVNRTSLRRSKVKDCHRLSNSREMLVLKRFKNWPDSTLLLPLKVTAGVQMLAVAEVSLALIRFS